MHYLGIDIGASFIKAARLDTGTGVIEKAVKVPSPNLIEDDRPWIRELDPTQVWNAVHDVLLEVVDDQGIDGILVSNQMHGFLLLDDSGKELTPYITWQDQRGADEASVSGVSESFGNEGLRKTGMPLMKGLPSLNLYHQCHQEGFSEGLFLSLGDFICHRLCGSVKVHASNCAGSGLMDLEAGEWNRAALGKMGCGGFKMPELAPDFCPIGLCEELDDAEVFAAVGDQQAALLGAMLSDGDLSLNVGTGSQVSMLSHGLEFGAFQTRPFFSDDYLKTITHIPAGRALNVLVAFSRDLVKRTTGIDISDEVFWSAFQNIEYGNMNLDVDLSFFPGSATGDSGMIANIREGRFTMEDVLAAAYRTMIRNYFDLSRKIGAEAASRLVISGGLILKNDILRRAVKERFDPLPMIQRYSEDTLVGLYIVARAKEMGVTDFREVYKDIEGRGLNVTDASN